MFVLRDGGFREVIAMELVFRGLILCGRVMAIRRCAGKWLYLSGSVIVDARCYTHLSS
jgi:hypothetical protein